MDNCTGLLRDPYNHIFSHMKTTIDLPDRLLRAAKTMAARRGTTLKALMTHALERELHDAARPAQAGFEVDDEGMPCLPRRGVSVTSGVVNRLLDEEDAE